MTIELSPDQLAVLHDTREAADFVEFQGLLDGARPEMDRIVRETMEPAQPIATTVLELRDLYLSVVAYAPQLASVNYGPARSALLRDSIRLVSTADLWFGEGTRSGAFRPRSVEEVVSSSRPWRARIKAYGAQAFVFEPDIAEQFADVNSSGTLDEERRDLAALNDLVEQHHARLALVGMRNETVAQGKALLDEASGRDLLGVLGLRNQVGAIVLRNRIITYATLLGGEARAAGINGCYDDAEAKGRFEAASFRNALRRLRPRRRDASVEVIAAPAAASANDQPPTTTPR